MSVNTRLLSVDPTNPIHVEAQEIIKAQATRGQISTFVWRAVVEWSNGLARQQAPAQVDDDSIADEDFDQMLDNMM